MNMEAEGIISGRNGSKPRQVLGRDDTDEIIIC